jgi:hypothetical protein
LIVEKFTKCLNEYSTYLETQNIEISRNHQLEIPVRSIDDSISVKIYDSIHFLSINNIYNSLNEKLSTLPYWEALDIEPFVPSESRYKQNSFSNLLNILHL